MHHFIFSKSNAGTISQGNNTQLYVVERATFRNVSRTLAFRICLCPRFDENIAASTIELGIEPVMSAYEKRHKHFLACQISSISDVRVEDPRLSDAARKVRPYYRQMLRKIA